MHQTDTGHSPGNTRMFKTKSDRIHTENMVFRQVLLTKYLQLHFCIDLRNNNPLQPPLLEIKRPRANSFLISAEGKKTQTTANICKGEVTHKKNA